MIGNFFQKIADWEFLDEPLYKWFIFYIAMIAIAITWNIILGYMK